MPITNVDELRDYLAKELEKVSSGEINPATANASANLVGKMLSSVKLELEHSRIAGSGAPIPFLKGITKIANMAQKLEHDKQTGEIKHKEIEVKPASQNNAFVKPEIKVNVNEMKK